MKKTPSNKPSGEEPIHVAVCICTYRRPDGLKRLLAGLCQQVFEDVASPSLSIIVTDNECSRTNQAICEAFVRQHGLSIRYLQEKQRGISYARNRCLDNLPADADFVAMIDDDEVPEAGWLNHLLYAQERASADIVTGPVLPVFGSDTPAWVKNTGYFTTPHHPNRYRDLEPFPPTATGNVLVCTAVFTTTKLRFDPALALSGSEDKLLFQDLKQRGLSFVWAANANVNQIITAERAQLGYMLSEALRRGSTRFYVKTKLKATTRSRRYKLAVRSTLRSLFGIGRGSIGAGLYLLGGENQRHKAASSLLSATENVGFLGGVFGYRKKHY